MEAIGWAVTSSSHIFVKTVSETRRAAIVNYLVAEHHINITNLWTDDQIEAAWLYWGRFVNCKRVQINTTIPGSEK